MTVWSLYHFITPSKHPWSLLLKNTLFLGNLWSLLSKIPPLFSKSMDHGGWCKNTPFSMDLGSSTTAHFDILWATRAGRHNPVTFQSKPLHIQFFWFAVTPSFFTLPLAPIVQIVESHGHGALWSLIYYHHKPSRSVCLLRMVFPDWSERSVARHTRQILGVLKTVKYRINVVHCLDGQNDPIWTLALCKDFYMLSQSSVTFDFAWQTVFILKYDDHYQAS